MDENRIMWTPSEDSKRKSAMWRFMESAQAEYGVKFDDYEALHDWSVKCADKFWTLLLREFSMVTEGELKSVCKSAAGVEKPELVRVEWFEGLRLCVAENLLRDKSERTALVSYVETQGEPKRISHADLFSQVTRVACYCRDVLGIREGDVVAAVMPNVVETIVLMLAVNALGCVWTSCSPDFGIHAVLDRFGQVKPKLLLVSDCYFYKGRMFNTMSKTDTIVAALSSLAHVLVVQMLPEKSREFAVNDKYRCFSDALEHEQGSEDFAFCRQPSSAPLYIMYSSGTTGKPKSIVHGWGVLVNQLKEHKLHLDVEASSRMLFFTTCGWMMWNWSLAALGVGATLVLYDGAPILPDDPPVLFRLAAAEEVTHFGTSAGYLTALEGMSCDVAQVFRDGVKKLSKRTIRKAMVTGSSSSAANFQLVRDQLGADVQYVSMSGGTDINSCFALGCPLKPVIIEQLQCRALAADVAVQDDDGHEIVEQLGELVCRNAIPAMPLFFWNDEHFEAYRGAYFKKSDKVWRHGDFAEITREKGVIIRGRSDATMNPGGVRIGSGDFYSLLRDVEGIEDAVVVGQRWKGDERIVLFVVPAEGAAKLGEDLEREIRALIRSKLSPRHVPAKVLAISDVPYTFNGKKAEISVKRMLDCQAVPNRDALRNPQSLDELESIRTQWESD